MLCGTVMAVAEIAHQGIQEARELDASEIKNTIKTAFSQTSYGCNVGTMVTSFADLFHSLVNDNTWRCLTGEQQAIIVTGVILALISSAYTLSQFDIEEHTLTAGIAATTSTALVCVCDNIATLWATEENLPMSDRNWFKPQPRPSEP